MSVFPKRMNDISNERKDRKKTIYILSIMAATVIKVFCILVIGAFLF
jgi:hypothetical protein